MILRGFEIENWSCISRLTVEDIPPDGVVVLHGPNGTGKSSIVHALRACLMDFRHGSADKDLKRWFPPTETPRVRVTFDVAGKTYRAAKEFKKNGKCLLESKTATGWSKETDNASQVDDRVLELCGGKDTSSGLNRLLWLTQAEFRLPSEKEFQKETELLGGLRRVLGALQTPTDDAFQAEIQRRWEAIFTAKSTRQKPAYKQTSDLYRCEEALTAARDRHREAQAAFETAEAGLERRKDLEIKGREVKRALEQAERERSAAQAEYDRLKPLAEARAALAERMTERQAEVDRCRSRLAERDGLATIVAARADETRQAREQAETDKRELAAAETALEAAKTKAKELADRRRHLERERARIAAVRKAQAARQELAKAEAGLREAESAGADLRRKSDALERMPNPDPETITKLQKLHDGLAQDRARLRAAALAVVLEPDDGRKADVEIDGSTGTHGSRAELSVRHAAELTLPGWGRVSIRRGSDDAGIEELEAAVAQAEAALAEGIAAFGIAQDEPAPLDRLRRMDRDRALLKKEVDRDRAAFEARYPAGVAGLERNRDALRASVGDDSAEAEVPDEAPLETERERVEAEFSAAETEAEKAEKRLQQVKARFDSANAKRIEREATLAAEEKAFDALPGRDALLTDLEKAEAAHAAAKADLAAAPAAGDLQAAKSHLDQPTANVGNLRRQLGENETALARLVGETSASEGCHQRLTEAAAELEAREAQNRRLKLDADAIDRLRDLFARGRESQSTAVVKPIADRIGEWLRLLRVPGARELSISGHFLPNRLAGEAGELEFDQESTGTVEQLALMTRLALGGLLSSPGDPAVAVLDDPLTHSDTARLARMQAVLASAAAGRDRFGPLQILVFTCHPEWFPSEAGRSFDLGEAKQRRLPSG